VNAREVLSRVVKSKTFKAVVAVLAAALTAYAASGCGLLGGATPRHPSLDVFECQLAAFEAVVPKAAAEDLVMAARNGNIEYLVKQLLRLGVSEKGIERLAEAFGECAVTNRGATPSPAPAPVQLLQT
jgi:hypothetical protein